MTAQAADMMSERWQRWFASWRS